MLHTSPSNERLKLPHQTGALAAAKVKAAGGSVSDQWSAHIAATFGPFWQHNALKSRVQRWLSNGARAAATQARFARRAEDLIGWDLRAACAAVDLEYRLAQRRNALPLALEVLREMRLALRWMRFRRMEREYRDAIATLAPRYTEAAE